MATIIWFEHMYQPAWNVSAYGMWNPKKMIEECYRPNLTLMKKLGIKFVMNMTQTMKEFFERNDALDVIDGYAELGSQVEFVGSSAHHILTIAPYSAVMDAELRDQHQFIQTTFGQRPQVFFPPEMAIDETTERVVLAAGYKGLLVSGGSPNFKTHDTTGVFSNNLTILPHNPTLSSAFSFPQKPFENDSELDYLFARLATYTHPVLLAFDHETFGGYNNPDRLGMKERFITLALSKGHQFIHASDALTLPPYGRIELRPTTWVGDYSKWSGFSDRKDVITKALSAINPANEYAIRKEILPSCHLHADYATEHFWNYVRSLELV